jgi:purine-binding chemotaxis protein CheW
MPGGIPWASRSAEDALDALFRAYQEAGTLVEDGDLPSLQRSEAEAEEDQRQLLTFSLGSEDYSLDIDCIREIIKPREITDIPRVPDFILGIISLRGIIIPVFDLKRRLKLGVGEMTPASRIIVCQQEEKITGLLVDGISQVIRVPGNSIEPPPAVLSGVDRDMVEGVGRYQGKMTILLRLSCIMDAELI